MMSKENIYPVKAKVESNLGDQIKKLLKANEIILLLLLLVEIVIMSNLSSKFFTIYNLLNMTRNFIERGIIALGMTMIIITSGIDLSVGSLTGMCAMVIGVFWGQIGINIWGACLVCLLIGVIAGFINGVIISKIKLPPLVVTLATLSVYRGLAYSISKAKTFSGFPEKFFFIGQSNIGNTHIPFQLLIFFVLSVIFFIILKYTAFGRKVYFIGYNESCAQFTGVNISAVKIILYSVSGLLCAIAAIIMVSRVSATRADLGTGMELDVITAVLIGGTSIVGGEGTILGTILGLFVIVILTNGLALAGFSAIAQTIAVGIVLIVSVYVRTQFKRKA